MKIYLSPSSQSHNAYAAGNTTEQAQCNRIAAAAKTALERNGYTVKKAPEGQSYTKNVAESNAWGADIHMPIHTNAGDQVKEPWASVIRVVSTTSICSRFIRQ